MADGGRWRGGRGGAVGGGPGEVNVCGELVGGWMGEKEGSAERKGRGPVIEGASGNPFAEGDAGK